MARKSAPSTGGLIVGLDIGYGVTKLVSPDRSDVIFPSVWGPAHNASFDKERRDQKFPGFLIKDDDGGFSFVGALAIEQLQASVFDLRGGGAAMDDQFSNLARRRFAQVALGQLFLGAHDGDIRYATVATGLPVSAMNDAQGLKSALLGVHCIQTNACEITINVQDVVVMPQPYGTIYSQMFTDAGEFNRGFSHRRVGVIDVGMYTIDAVLDQEGGYVHGESGSTPLGVHVVHEAIRDAFNAEVGELPSPDQITAIMAGRQIMARGMKRSFQDALDAGLTTLRTATVQLATRLWRRGGNIDAIFVSGGGASLVIDAVRSQFPWAQITDNSQTANARGYLRYALAKRG